MNPQSVYDNEFPALVPQTNTFKPTKVNSVWNKARNEEPQYHAVATQPAKVSFSISSTKKKIKKPPPMFTKQTPSTPTTIPSPAPSAIPPSNTHQYPDTLIKYVQRALNSANNEEERQLIQQEVTRIISQSISNNKLWTCNWNARRIPQVRELKGEPPENGASSLGKRQRELLVTPPGVQEFLTETHKDKRMKRFKEEATAPSKTTKKTKYQKRKEFFASDKPQKSKGALVGTCTTLEKTYFRQISDPDPSTIRPEWVLRKTLKLIKRKWRLKEVNYVYICEQFKSIRQDLTIQQIKNAFTVEVYETHARLALENKDLVEFHQCQTQLKSLYESAIPGSTFEFAAYRILYALHSAIQKASFSALLHAIQDLTMDLLNHIYVIHALQVKEAVITRNYEKFFRLYEESPNMGAYLMDHFVDSVRVQALRSVVRSYFPRVQTSFLATMMAFASEEVCIAFLKEHGAVVIYLKNELGFFVDCKTSKDRIK